MLALTPVSLYSMAMPAPNGIELAAALCVWASLLGILRGDRSVVRGRELAIVLGVSGVILATVRPLGPLWLGCILAICAFAAGLRRFLSLVRRPERGHVMAVSATILALAASAWWIMTQRQVASLESVATDDVPISPLIRALKEVPLWIFQSIAAFPLRNEPAPMPVYVLSLLLLVSLMWSAVVRARSRDRWSLVVVSFLALAAPFAITIATVRVAGTFWQGRYSLPLAFGVVLVTGVILDRTPVLLRMPRVTLVTGAVALAVIHVLGATALHAREMREGVLAGDPRWVFVPTWVIAGLMVLGVVIWTLTLLRTCALGSCIDGPNVNRDEAARSTTGSHPAPAS
jgi:hypothetical protein